MSLGAALEVNTALRSLWLWSTPRLRALRCAAPHRTALLTRCAAENRVGDRGASAIGDALKVNPTIECVLLDGTRRERRAASGVARS
jgi:hypothetical protein